MNNESFLRNIQINNETDLSLKIHGIIESIKNEHHEIYTLAQLIPIEENNYTAYFVQDNTKVIVNFYHNNEALIMDNYTDDIDLIMNVQEIQLLKALGKIDLNGIAYKISNITFSIENKDIDYIKKIIIELK